MSKYSDDVVQDVNDYLDVKKGIKSGDLPAGYGTNRPGLFSSQEVKDAYYGRVLTPQGAEALDKNNISGFDNNGRAYSVSCT